MHSFQDFVRPLAAWLHTNPNWALIFTFLISCAESLAIIGSIVPGSLTMTAIGILAGSGVMRLDLTLFFASLGALAGDGISYTLGFVFSDKLTQIWPFKQYPKLLDYGKDFFIRHGGKSVLIGRFIGPLRSIIPLIAGMMHMQKSHFFFANLISAIGWSILYVMPGYLIGTASNQLTTNNTHFFMFVMILLIIIWFVSKGIQSTAQIIYRWYNSHVNIFLRWSKRNHLLEKWRNYLYIAEVQYINRWTVTIIFMALLSLLTLTIISFSVIQDTWIHLIDTPVSLFLQSLRTRFFDYFFIVITLIISPISLLGVFLIITTAMLNTKNWRLLIYWLSLSLVTFAIILLMANTIHISTPTSLSKLKTRATFPEINLALSTSLFTFIMCYITRYNQEINSTKYLKSASNVCMKNRSNNSKLSFSKDFRINYCSIITIFLMIILILAGVSFVYLGDNWMSSILGSYFLGLTIGLTHWILYQKHRVSSHKISVIILFVLGSLITTTTIGYFLYFKKTIVSHITEPRQYEVTEDNWWHQDASLLPIYTTNRVGKNIGLFNIQYAGSLKNLEIKLSKYGWRKQSSSFLYSLIIRVNGQHSAEALPVIEPLYLNKKPILIMTYATKHNNLYILRLWRSNYHISNYKEPIWLGSVVIARKKTSGLDNNTSTTLFAPMLPAIKHYRFANITVNNKKVKSLRYAIPPELLIIKDH